MVGIVKSWQLEHGEVNCLQSEYVFNHGLIQVAYLFKIINIYLDRKLSLSLMRNIRKFSKCRSWTRYCKFCLSGEDGVSPFAMVEETSDSKPFFEHKACYSDRMAFLSMPDQIFRAVNATPLSSSSSEHLLFLLGEFTFLILLGLLVGLILLWRLIQG